VSGADDVGDAAGNLGCEVVTTRSGARAVRDLATGELMHPIVGPRVEAEELYVAPSRLEARLARGGPPGQGALVLLDVGLGAGSNAIAAWRGAERTTSATRRLEVVSFDRTASALELALREEHAASFGYEGDALRAAQAVAMTGAHESARTSWRLVIGELPGALERMGEGSADIVFWDPFSPRANPSLWTVAAFATVRRLCRPGATLHTYGAATSARAALLLAGFAVGAGVATREDKQTTIAAVSAADLVRPLDRRWLERLGRSSAPLPSDAPPDALARIAALPQFDP
jgi:queuine tRNA-ribosyltransferase